MLKELSSKFEIVIYNTNYEDFSDIETEHIAIFDPDKTRASSIAYLSEIIKRMRAAMNNFVLVVIDLDRFFESTTSQTIKAAELKDLWGTGGHQRILPIIESKMPKYVPAKVIDNNNLFYIGQFKDPDNQRRLKAYATPEELGALDRHQFIEIDDWTNKRCLVEVSNGEITTIRELPDIDDAFRGIDNHDERVSNARGTESGRKAVQGRTLRKGDADKGASGQGKAAKEAPEPEAEGPEIDDNA